MILENLKEAPKDPILSLSAACKLDSNPNKVDLGIGVYRDEQGITPVMEAIKLAEARLLEAQTTKAYVGLAGNEAFNQSMIELMLGDNSSKSRAVGVQTPGASGALRMLADVIKASAPDATVWLSDLSYANHAPIMQTAGLTVRYFPYFDRNTKLVQTDAMMASLKEAGPNDVVLLHGCCHNPTGADLSFDGWQTITEMAVQQGFLPFIDMAYQGFGDGMEADAKGFRYLAERVESYVLTGSCSKNFGLYRERTGIAVIAAKTLAQSNRIKTRILEAARSSYTMPPDHGAELVNIILNDETLKVNWLNEVEQMRLRVDHLRNRLATVLREKSGHSHYDFIAQHKGMFSVLGISPLEAQTLSEKYSIYLVGSGRINIAGMQENHIDYIAESLLSL
ncbi:aspartate/tyrosine/aromatic aminotransferase [Marinomonas sp. 15G1-11]|mgnify:CR=1 FL=1|uniref:Aspartate/tyrosine/aromatic aminotransferase n=1 Tax=Marinomonas phaeophyticola TaxID=3004091 RepID=A0ABT4JSG7_9GAMM|nr:amino acid aminotransferase [Marinomonas sp. 15G1-11]MCZ2721326.1 aspartate/tyrosine/aromatic aminotransferase [Marinomonas sp. 15G1-11]